MTISHSLGPDDIRRIDLVCDRFEAELKAGHNPRIETFLEAAAEELREDLLPELISVELAYRMRRGDSIDATEYTTRFPVAESVIREMVADAEAEPTQLFTEKPDRVDEVHVPREFGDYEILEEVARGGMGVVYRARQKSLNRVVALKLILSGEFANEHVIGRFQKEAELAAGLNHPNIVPIYDFGRLSGRHFMCMGFIDGLSLDHVIAKRRFPARIAARIIRTCARAVEYAHSKGVVHRDIKPQNILINEYREPVITDFGLAKELDNDKNMTATGQVLGTANYMPPEQAAGQRDSVGPLADVYSLGATLFHMLTGTAPFAADHIITTLNNVIGKEPPKPRSIDSSIPLDLETICLKCLQKSPAHRYGSARELSDDLTRFLENQPIAARPAGRWERAWRRVRRSPTVAILSLLLLISIVVGFSTAAHYAGKLHDAPPAGQNSSLPTPSPDGPPAIVNRPLIAVDPARGDLRFNDPPRRAPVHAPKPRNTAALERLRQERDRLLLNQHGKPGADSARDLFQLARFAWESNDLAEARKRLDAIPKSLRTGAWKSLEARCRPVVIADLTDAIHNVRVSKDGLRLFVKTQAEVRAYDLSFRREMWRQSARGTILGYCANRAWVTAGKSIYHAETGALVRTFSAEIIAIDRVGSQLAILQDGDIKLRGMDVKAKPRTLARKARPQSAEFSHDGNRFAICDGRTLQIWNIYGWRLGPTQSVSTGPAMSAAYLPQSGAICWGMFDTRSQANQAPDVGVTNDVELVLPDVPRDDRAERIGRLVHRIAFSPDGKSVAFCRVANVVDIVSTESFVTSGRSTFRPEAITVRVGKNTRTISAVALMPGGTSLVTGHTDGKVRLWSNITKNISAYLPTKTTRKQLPGKTTRRPPIRIRSQWQTFALQIEQLLEARLTPNGLRAATLVRIGTQKSPVLYADGELWPLPDAMPEIPGTKQPIDKTGGGKLAVAKDTLAFFDDKGAVQVWNLSTGKLHLRIPLLDASAILQVSDDGKFLGILSALVLDVWNLHTKKRVIRDPSAQLPTTRKRLDPKNGLAIFAGPAGRRVAVFTPYFGVETRIYDVGSGKLTKTERDTLIVFAGNRRISFGTENGKTPVVVHDLIKDKEIIKFNAESSWPLFAPNGKWMIQYDTKTGQLVRTDLVTGKSIRRKFAKPMLGDVLDSGWSSSFSPDGARVIVPSGGQIYVLDSERLISIGKPVSGNFARFSADGKRILVVQLDIFNPTGAVGQLRYLTPNLKPLVNSP